MGNSVYRAQRRQRIFFKGIAKLGTIRVHSLSWGVDGDEGENAGCNWIRKDFVNNLDLKYLGVV